MDKIEFEVGEDVFVGGSFGKVGQYLGRSRTGNFVFVQTSPGRVDQTRPGNVEALLKYRVSEENYASQEKGYLCKREGSDGRVMFVVVGNSYKITYAYPHHEEKCSELEERSAGRAVARFRELPVPRELRPSEVQFEELVEPETTVPDFPDEDADLEATIERRLELGDSRQRTRIQRAEPSSGVGETTLRRKMT